MRCKPDVASPTGCRAASCRFLSFSVVFCRFVPPSPPSAPPVFLAVRSSCLPRRPLLLSSPPTAPPVFPADRSSCLLRRPLLSSPPSRSGPLYYYIIVRPSEVRPSGNGAVPCSVLRLARASSLSRLFPPTPCPCPFRAPFPPPRNIFFCYRTNGIRNISVNLSRKNPQSNRFQLKYLKINSYDFD